MIRILFSEVFLAVTSGLLHMSFDMHNCCLISNELHQINNNVLSEHDLIIIALNDSDILLHENLNKKLLLTDISGSLFLFLSDRHCYTCTEWIIEQLRKSFLIIKEKRVNVILQTNNLGSFYTLKKQLEFENLSFYYTQTVPEAIRNLNKSFFFVMNGKKVDRIYVPLNDPENFSKFLLSVN